MNGARLLRRIWGPCLSPRSLVLVAGLAVQAGQAHGAVTCTASTAGISLSGHSSEQTAGWSTSGSVTVTCTRTKSTDPMLAYFALGLDGGLNISGSQSRAKWAGGNAYLNYAVWQNVSMTAPWTNVTGTTGTRLRGQVNFGSSTVYSASATLPYYLNAQAAQVVPTGLYTDTQALSVYSDLGGDVNVANSRKADDTVTLPVQISVLENCVFSALPGDVVFAYTSFQTQAAVSSTSFSVRCPSGSPYSVSLDATEGSLLGLNYALALSPSGARSGTGLPQSTTITGTIAAGQSGTCSAGPCQATVTRILTITY